MAGIIRGVLYGRVACLSLLVASKGKVAPGHDSGGSYSFATNSVVEGDKR